MDNDSSTKACMVSICYEYCKEGNCFDHTGYTAGCLASG